MDLLQDGSVNLTPHDLHYEHYHEEVKQIHLQLLDPHDNQTF